MSLTPSPVGVLVIRGVDPDGKPVEHKIPGNRKYRREILARAKRELRKARRSNPS